MGMLLVAARVHGRQVVRCQRGRKLAALSASMVDDVAGTVHTRAESTADPRSAVDLGLLLGFAIFFLAQMSLGAKKMPRYVLPSLLALDVLAAAGIA